MNTFTYRSKASIQGLKIQFIKTKQQYRRKICQVSASKRSFLKQGQSLLLSGIALNGGYNSKAQQIAIKQQENIQSLSDINIDRVKNNLINSTQTFTLENGLTFVVRKRDESPTVSMSTQVNVGAFDEEDGQTGIAHMLEHMAFKGTYEIGTNNFKQEQVVLDQLDESYTELLATPKSDESQVRKLVNQFNNLQEQANSYIVPNQFGQILQSQGGVGLNASTSFDSTSYFVSLPSNKLEFWFYLESQRFQVPVFRDFYPEKKVVLEERQFRIEDTPFGKFYESFTERALSNNYRRPAIGYRTDIQNLTRRDITQFFISKYQPQNMIIGIAGNIDFDNVYNLAQKYFGKWQGTRTSQTQNQKQIKYYDRRQSNQSQKFSDNLWSNLPKPQNKQSKEYKYISKFGPSVILAYYRPPVTSYEAQVIDVATSILNGGRSARLYQQFISTGKAQTIQSDALFPGAKYPGLAIISGTFTKHFPKVSLEMCKISGVPSRGVDDTKFISELKGTLNQITNDKVSDQEMARIKRGSLINLFDNLANNSTVASALANYQMISGNWKQVLVDIDDVFQMTQDDVLTVSQKLFNDDNEFIGRITQS